MMREFDELTLKVDPPKKPKKITGTRFASILGLDKWNTPFKTWCAITKTYEDPFTENKYTTAGKVIEPKIIDYLNKKYFIGSVKSPTDIYGADYFKKTFGDFFPDESIFGGMWDALVYEDGKPVSVIEIKTSKRAEDWSDGQAPIYYSMQAALYANLLGIDEVVMVAAFLEEDDYEHPEDFVPSVDNTITDSFLVSERFPDFELDKTLAKAWWEGHVEGGISPVFDEKKDEEILKVLRTNTVSADMDIAALIKEAETLTDQIEKIRIKQKLQEKEDRLGEIKDLIKQYAIKQFREGDKKVSIPGKKIEWVVTKTAASPKVDTDKLKKDNLFEKYSKPGTPTYKLTSNEIKEVISK